MLRQALVPQPFSAPISQVAQMQPMAVPYRLSDPDYPTNEAFVPNHALSHGSRTYLPAFGSELLPTVEERSGIGDRADVGEYGGNGEPQPQQGSTILATEQV